jgi:hypothetical protein
LLIILFESRSEEVAKLSVGHKPENQEYKAVLRCDNRAS